MPFAGSVEPTPVPSAGPVGACDRLPLHVYRSAAQGHELEVAEHESRKERVDRELIELLNELRVALPGVQVLFAFLLTLPFTNRFREVSGSSEALYVVALVATAAASAFLIAPSAYHRLNFREPDKERMLFAANRLAIAGTALLALAVATVVYVVASFLYGPGVGGGLSGAVAGLLAWLWYGLPLLRRSGA